MRPIATLDIENLRAFFLVKFRCKTTKAVWNFALYPGSPPLDIPAIVALLQHFTIHTFNGWHYDVPVLMLALHGGSAEQLLECNDLIIKRGFKPWDIYRHYNIAIPEWVDHVDLFDVAPGVSIGLKMYMGRIHAPKLQDMPVDYDVDVTPPQRIEVDTYCGNDHEGTDLLGDGLVERLDLRVHMSHQYGVDLRSKSDAQIAEAVIKAQLGFVPDRRYVPHGFTFKYEPPEYIKFVSPQMKALLELVRTADFVVHDKEEAVAIGLDSIKTGVKIPEALKGLDIVLGRAKYRMGIGGLHSQESSTFYMADAAYRIRDVDVKSYYPSLILSLGMYPTQLGPTFSRIFRGVYDERLRAKDAGEMTISDGLKIVLNGTFGKLFSKWSILYAPELGIRVTITGQLALLMLIEMMEQSNIRVLSANTDGIVLGIPKGYEWLADGIVQWWERTTGLQMEATEYRIIAMRDVNNYVAITQDNKAKRKGVFAPGGLLSGPQGKHPDKDICADAVVALLKDGVPIADTIMACRDIRKFVQIRHCKSGAIDLPAGVAINDGRYLGKAVRFYFNGRPGYIGMAGTGHKVAGTDGATPLMELPNYFPLDVNYAHYIGVANSMLNDIGVTL